MAVPGTAPRIVDRFRRRRHEAIAEVDDDAATFTDLLPSPDGRPEAAYARRVLLEELEAALDELPPEQRVVFIAHELEGRQLNELAAATGVRLNTLLARKRYAVLHLRRRLQPMTHCPNPEEMTMRGRWLLRGLKIASIVAVLIAAVGAAVMLLWNALLPSLFGWSAITFWQAVGLLVLSRILIGGLRGGWGHGGYWRARMAAR